MMRSLEKTKWWRVKQLPTALRDLELIQEKPYLITLHPAWKSYCRDKRLKGVPF